MQYPEVIKKLLTQIRKYGNGEKYTVISMPKESRVLVYKNFMEVGQEELIDVYDIGKGEPFHIHEYEEWIEVPVFGKIVNNIIQHRK